MDRPHKFARIKPASEYESNIQAKVIAMLRSKEWFVKNMHGNHFQSGVPDLYACHTSYGARWIEVKHPTRGRFTSAQLVEFPKFCAHGAGIWVLTAATEDQYKLLFKRYNYFMFLDIFR